MSIASLDLTPFALPGTPAHEVRFEEPRDLIAVEVAFEGEARPSIGLSYLRKTWPDVRVEEAAQGDPCYFGWTPQDDWFNSEWTEASIVVEHPGDGVVRVSFAPLTAEYPEATDYDVAYRRTLGIRVDGVDPQRIKAVRTYSRSEPVRSALRIRLTDAPPTSRFPYFVSPYNAEIERLAAEDDGDGRTFRLDLRRLLPVTEYCGDDALLTFTAGDAAFTISLSALDRQGPIYLAEHGVLVTHAADDTDLAAYLARNAGAATLAQRVRDRGEQSLAGAQHGQPRPHPVSYTIGCPYTRQRFWIEPNGDLVMHKRNVAWIPGRDTERFANAGDARFYFGLEQWLIQARFPDPEPTLAYNIHARRGDVRVEMTAFATALTPGGVSEDLEGDDPVAAFIRLRFTNTGAAPCDIAFPLAYAQDSGRGPGGKGLPRDARGTLVPRAALDPLAIEGDAICSVLEDRTVPRAVVDTSMTVLADGDCVTLRAALPPEGAIDAVLKVPYVSPTDAELDILRGRSFDAAHAAVAEFWRAFAARGAQVCTPEPRLDALHRMHPVHVAVTDLAMPGERRLINTSVGSSTYGNFSNESCMIVHDLDQRGLHDEARRRIEVWIKYQGTAPQPGNFTDYDGMFYGAGGFEQGAYNQHHGWVLWCVCEHFLLTHDQEWFARVAPNVLAGADWIFRQRRNTMAPAPLSRGWERGFLPAGSLEDVTDFYYWLSTNSLTWRGAEYAAQALERFGHPEAPRVRREADAYAADLRRGFDAAARHAPAVRLRDGRWVPHYPSRLYRRGRETGWIRETLEGAVYLLISGLYDPNSPEAGWILDDFQDNRYPAPPYGYAIPDFEADWYDRAGVSIQPNLLAGLLPYLDRDEPELYIWMFFNAWAACYRDEINAMVEHPLPVLGYANQAHYKTSDQSNAVSWLRNMFVYGAGDALWLGRAVPRAWFFNETPFGAQGVVTRFGRVSVEYRSVPGERRIDADVALDLAVPPSELLLRFRTPDGAPLGSVRLDGEAYTRFDANSGDVDLTGREGRLSVSVTY